MLQCLGLKGRPRLFAVVSLRNQHSIAAMHSRYVESATIYSTRCVFGSSGEPSRDKRIATWALLATADFDLAWHAAGVGFSLVPTVLFVEHLERRVIRISLSIFLS